MPARSTTKHRFGGRWTAEKLDILRKYLSFYTLALSRQKFDLVYIDAFAGTGRCEIAIDGGRRTIDGSAKIALDCAPGFACYRFIEKKRHHAEQLEALIAMHPNGQRASVVNLRAGQGLPQVLAAHNWKSTRGVLFLDPYGLQCDWSLMEQIAATEALDVFFLLSLSGLYRQAAVDASGIDEHKAARLTAVLGTAGWREHLYTREQFGLFDGPTLTREPGYRDILQFTTERFRGLFPHVADPALLGLVNGAPLFALYFIVANPHPKAVELAGRVSREVLTKLR